MCGCNHDGIYNQRTQNSDKKKKKNKTEFLHMKYFGNPFFSLWRSKYIYNQIDFFFLIQMS